jgi:hypothetical protein
VTTTPYWWTEVTQLALPLTLLPTAVLNSEWFAVLTAFVALNTIMYVALAVAKMLPKVYVSDWASSRNRRSRTRSIYPEGHVHVAAPERDPRDLLDAVG